MSPDTPTHWRGRPLIDMSKQELIDVIASLARAQHVELEFVRQSRDKWMRTAFEGAKA